MIESITLSGIATYSPVTPEMIQNLKAVNYFYGANGAGKTTISRLIKQPSTINCLQGHVGAGQSDSGNGLQQRLHRCEFH